MQGILSQMVRGCSQRTRGCVPAASVRRMAQLRVIVSDRQKVAIEKVVQENARIKERLRQVPRLPPPP
eukprot:COSAG01_NODE_43012_length_434_cov_0.695522_1_plen_67_part_10